MTKRDGMSYDTSLIKLPKDREIKNVTITIPDPLRIGFQTTIAFKELMDIGNIPKIVEIDYPKKGIKRYKLIDE